MPIGYETSDLSPKKYDQYRPIINYVNTKTQLLTYSITI